MATPRPRPSTARAMEELNVQIVNVGVEWTKVVVTLLLVVLAGLSFYFRRSDNERDAIMKKVIEESTSRDKEVVRLKSANLDLQEQLENTIEEAALRENLARQLRNCNERVEDLEGEVRRYQKTIRIQEGEIRRYQETIRKAYHEDIYHQAYQERGPPLPRHGPPVPPVLEATPMGRCVHLPGCRDVNRGAQVRSYRPCSRCFPQYVGQDFPPFQGCAD